MLEWVNPDYLEARGGLDARYRHRRLTQAETSEEVRKDPNVLQWILLDRNEELVRYNPKICIPDAPEYREAIAGAITVTQAELAQPEA